MIQNPTLLKTNQLIELKEGIPVKKQIQQLLKNKTGAFSIEMLMAIGVIVVLVILSMTAFSRESSEMSNQYDKNVSNALHQQSLLNSQLVGQQKRF